MIRNAFLVSTGLVAVACASSQAGSASVSSVTPPRSGVGSASSPAASSADACYDRFATYCPDPGDGAKTCTDKHGDVQQLSLCAGHCAGSQCVLGGAACDTRPTVGAACTAGAKCAYVSRMGNQAFTCEGGKWSETHAGI